MIEDEEKREKRLLRKGAFIINKYYRKKIFKRADLLTIFGKKVEGVAYGRPAINLVNGVDVNAVPLRKPDLVENEVHILLLASMCYWQGYDRMINALHNYSGQTRVVLHFVGKVPNN